jgi:hypothetical protein
MNEFLKKLKAGDLVAVSGRSFTAIRKVEKITPSGLIKVNGVLFDKNGCKRGCDTWSRTYLIEATPELIEKTRRSNAISTAYNLMRNAKNITFEQAKKIIEILSPNDKENIT